MNTVQNGKGDKPRNNWGPKWDAGYAAIDWHREQRSGNQRPSPVPGSAPSEGQQHNGAAQDKNGACSSAVGKG